MSGGPKVAVLGAGSVGCFVGGAWQAAGLDVSFIGRSKFNAEVARHGLQLSDYAGWNARLPPADVDYRTTAEALDDADIILVAVKSGNTAEAAAVIDKHGRDGTSVISLQNGISNLETLERGLRGRFEIVRGMVGFNIAYLGEGRFHKGVAGELWSARSDTTQLLAERVGQGPARLMLADDMLALAWGKLLINTNNAVNALSGRTLLEELAKRDYRRVFAASIQEGLRLLRRAEIKPAKVGPLSLPMLARVLKAPDWLFKTLVARAWKVDPHARSSMADDLAAGRKTEVEFLNGELVRLAERLQAEAPVSRKIVDLVHKAEGGAKPLAPAALRRAVLGR